MGGKKEGEKRERKEEEKEGWKKGRRGERGKEVGRMEMDGMGNKEKGKERKRGIRCEKSVI